MMTGRSSPSVQEEEEEAVCAGIPGLTCFSSAVLRQLSLFMELLDLSWSFAGS